MAPEPDGGLSRSFWWQDGKGIPAVGLAGTMAERWQRSGTGQCVWVGVEGTQWWGVAGDDGVGLLKGLAVPQGREEFLRRVTGAGFTWLCGDGMSCRLLEP